MVNVLDIERPKRRFVSRKELESIKDRAQRLPHGNYYIKDDTLYCSSVEADRCRVDKAIVKILHPGAEVLLKEVKRDLENLITHVEQADQENDYLLSLLAEEEEEGDEASGD